MPAPTWDPPVLVGCAHGTREAAGRRAVGQLRLAAAALRPGLEVVAAHVDVHKPALDDVVARLCAAGRRCVVVPMLLSTGFHVRTDIARAVAASGGLAVAAAPLGPDADLAEALAGRLAESGYGATPATGEDVVLVAAGSGDDAARDDVEVMAALLADRLGLARVTPAYLTASRPRVADAVAAGRAGGRQVALATYLLAPGWFTTRLAGIAADAGAARVSPPLGPHPAVAGLVVRRYDDAVAAAWTTHG